MGGSFYGAIQKRRAIIEHQANLALSISVAIFGVSLVVAYVVDRPHPLYPGAAVGGALCWTFVAKGDAWSPLISLGVTLLAVGSIIARRISGRATFSPFADYGRPYLVSCVALTLSVAVGIAVVILR